MNEPVKGRMQVYCLAPVIFLPNLSLKLRELDSICLEFNHPAHFTVIGCSGSFRLQPLSSTTIS